MKFKMPLRRAVRRYRRYGAYALAMSRDPNEAKKAHGWPAARKKWNLEARWAFTAAARLVLIGVPILSDPNREGYYEAHQRREGIQAGKRRSFAVLS